MAMITSALLPMAGAGEAIEPPLVVESRIPLGNISGRIDHLAFDAARQRLYVAELENNSVGIVDLKAGRLLRTVEGFDEPQGIAYEPETDTVYVANGGDGTVRLFKGADFVPLGTVSTGGDADNVRVDAVAHRVYVGVGNGAIAVLDSLSRRRIADIPLAGHPESFQLHPDGDLIYVNVPNAHQVAVLSRRTNRQVATWQTGELRSNFPLVLDPAQARVISGFRSPARLQIHPIATGQPATVVESCGDSDDLFLDQRRHRLYVVCGEGYVETRDASASNLALLGRVKTSGGSRTGLYIPELDRLVVAIRGTAGEPAALWILRPAP